jgi:para-nitrobenzyl esterase
MPHEEMRAMNRRRFLSQVSGVAAGSALAHAWGPDLSSILFAQATQAAPGPVVEIASGRVRGVIDAGVHVFKGIPYGAPTGGANRFRAPQPAQTWTGVREALEYGPTAAQGTVRTASGSEDCLVLNVWTRGLGDNGRRPVMVWLHGGGFSTLSGSSPMYDGANLALRGDVVVVTLNHRLNVFGYLHLSDLAGAEWAAASNAGMLDIIQALQWVRTNIARFGGDPGNVTIFGESGGGRKVSTLLAMPGAKGLFHRAIIQSGPGLHLQPRDRSHEIAIALFRQLGIAPGRVDQLQAVPMEVWSPRRRLSTIGSTSLPGRRASSSSTDSCPRLACPRSRPTRSTPSPRRSRPTFPSSSAPTAMSWPTRRGAIPRSSAAPSPRPNCASASW